FMSVMVLNLLENIIDEQNYTHSASGKTTIDSSPAAILEKLNDALTKTLRDKKTDATSKYGMDIALCALSDGEGGKKNSVLEYAGAHHPLYILRNNKITEIRGEGIFIGMESKKFANHTADLVPGDSVFLFSDGIVDQFGGSPREKLFSFRFKEWLETFSGKDAKEQHELLKKKFFEWKGNEDQIDDILIMGVTV
ncbi:MAG: serine/threonine-protein phosphatase, partial [Bacteroidia bacterium]|nr:serine/threonine-protein phosphatase [Bacteroidia bacterium]